MQRNYPRMFSRADDQDTDDQDTVRANTSRASDRDESQIELARFFTV